jgi:hypothetical protein
MRGFTVSALTYYCLSVYIRKNKMERACIEETRSMYKILVINFEGNTKEGVCRRSILKLILVKLILIYTGLKWLGLSTGVLL